MQGLRNYEDVTLIFSILKQKRFTCSEKQSREPTSLTSLMRSHQFCLGTCATVSSEGLHRVIKTEKWYIIFFFKWYILKMYNLIEILIFKHVI